MNNNSFNITVFKMMKKNHLSLFIFILFVFNLSEISGQTKSLNKILVNDLNTAINTSEAIALSPLRIESFDWKTLTGTIVVTSALFAVDRNLRSFALKTKSNLNDKIFQMDKVWGNYYTALFAGSIYFTGLSLGSEKIRLLGLHASEAFLFSGLITFLVKGLLGRRRPYMGKDQLFFKPLQFFDNDYQSLPSGHTSVAFAVSTVMANYINNIFWKIFWYGAAVTVAASRVYHNQHWLSDVFLGGMLGYSVGQFVLNFNKHTGKKEFSYLFSFTGNGIELRYYFF